MSSLLSRRFGLTWRVNQKTNHHCPFCWYPIFVMGMNHKKYSSLKMVRNATYLYHLLSTWSVSLAGTHDHSSFITASQKITMGPRLSGWMRNHFRTCPCFHWHCQGFGQDQSWAQWEVLWRQPLPCLHPNVSNVDLTHCLEKAAKHMMVSRRGKAGTGRLAKDHSRLY